MILKMFSVHDSKSELYSPPSCYRARGLALRHFGELCNQSDSPYAKNPEDFHIWEIGEYDDNTCEIKMYKQPVNLGCATDFANGKLQMAQNITAESPVTERIQ